MDLLADLCAALGRAALPCSRDTLPPDLAPEGTPTASRFCTQPPPLIPPTAPHPTLPSPPEAGRSACLSSLQILGMLSSHPNVAALLQTYEDDEAVHIVLELVRVSVCVGG